MKQGGAHFGAGFIAGVISLLLLMLLAMLVVVYTGSYNVAASADHTSFVRWMFTTTLHSSIQRHASSINAPASFSEASIRSGAGKYKAMCEHCHGGPGVKKSEWARGMLPQPPHLPDEVSELQANEVFWVVKHGLKMSGMPSFGETHSDETLWNIVAFVKQLPGMTAETYASFETDHAGSGDQAH